MDLKVNQLINIPTKGFSRVISIGIVGILFAQPVFFFSIPGWTTRIGVASYLICLIAIIFDRSNLTNKITSPPKIYWWIIFSLCSFFLATLISQAANNTFVANRLDSPSRLLFATLIFHAIYRYKINFVAILKASIPITIILFLLQTIFKEKNISTNEISWDGRFSLPFMDPILLSTWIITFGLFCLNFIKLRPERESLAKDFIFISCLIIAIYIALLTESRTGLIGIPIVMVLIILKHPKKSIAMSFFIALTISAFYFAHKNGANLARINQAFFEFNEYFNGGHKESSVGLRIDMGLLAFKAWLFKPFFGWGENFFSTQEIQVYLNSNFTSSAIYLSQYSGFHSDLYAAMVRSGALGIIAYATTFFTPLFFFIYLLLRENIESKEISIIGLSLIIPGIITSMTVEILAYKYSVTIFSYLIAGVMAQAVWKSQTT